MGTLMDKLNATNASKEQIRQAIERKKVSVPAETPLKDYPAKIDGIYPDAIFMQENNFGNGCTTKFTENEIVTQWPRKVIYGNGVYVGCDLLSTRTGVNRVNQAVLVKSSKESDWIRYGTAQTNEIVFFKGVFVCVDNASSLLLRWSINGKTWNTCSFSDGTKYFSGVFFSDDKYLYIIDKGDSYTKLYRSENGKAFSLVDTSGYPTGGYPITSMVYSKKYKKYYMCQSKWSGGAPRFLHFYSEDLKTWTPIKNMDGDFEEIGGRLYCNYFRNESSIVNLESYYTDDGITWKKINVVEGLSVDKNINVFSEINGVYFAFNYNQYTLYTIYYSANGLDNWKKMKFPTKLSNQPNWSICNGIVFNLRPQMENVEYIEFTRNYSFDGFSWFNEIHSMFVDQKGNNVTNKVVKDFVGTYSQDMLQAAYEAGVNSI